MVSKFISGRRIKKTIDRTIDKFIYKNRRLAPERLLELINLKLLTLIIRQIRKKIEGCDTEYLGWAIERLKFYKDNLEKEIK